MKTIGISKCVYDLVRVLEELENELEFTAFYPFSRILESHHFCPAWDFEGVYYEIQYDNEDCLQVLDFGIRGHREIGNVLNEKDVVGLTKSILEAWANKIIKNDNFDSNNEELLNFCLFGRTQPFISPKNYETTKVEKLSIEEIIVRFGDLLTDKDIENLKRLNYDK